MAIKLPDPGNGIPEQKTGNDEWTNMKIVRDNFADQSNAASRLVGTANGRVPLAEDAFGAVYAKKSTYSPNGFDDFNSLKTGDKVIYDHSQNSGTTANAPPVDLIGSGGAYAVFNEELHYTISQNLIKQTAVGYLTLDAVERLLAPQQTSRTTEWRPANSNRFSYLLTTGTAPNVVVDSNGVFKRSSSSAKYKNIISELELDSDLYQKAMQVNPIVYRSKADGDPKDWHYMSFLAEEIGELDPSLTQWKTHDYDSETGELVELEEKEAEGINLNAICAVLHATNIYQDKKLKELEQRLTVLESNR